MIAMAALAAAVVPAPFSEAPCRGRPGEIVICAHPDRRSPYRLPLPDERAPQRHAGEFAHVGIGDSPARVPPGLGLTLTVPIGGGGARTGKATIAGTADARDR